MLRSSAWAVTWALVRLTAAVTCVAAVAAQLLQSVTNSLDAGTDTATVVANFLSFFTIQSNVVAAVALAIGAVVLWRRRRDEAPDPAWFAVLLVCATTYMITTGVVYNTLLRSIQLPQGTTVPWSNEVLHAVIPVVMLLDLALAPRRRSLPWRTLAVVVVYPIAWVVYTLLRGPLVASPLTGQSHWYPYPFLDPNNPALVPPGYAGVLVYVVAIAAAIIAAGLLVVAVGRTRARWDAEGSTVRRSTPPTRGG